MYLTGLLRPIMVKITHVFSGTTFISECEHFNRPDLLNTVIIITSAGPLKVNCITAPLFFSNKKKGLKEAAKICSESDITVFYELDYEKAYMISKLSDNIIVAWRFFGAELYDKNPVPYLSDDSLRFFRTKYGKFRKIINPKRIIDKLSGIANGKWKANSYFQFARKRTDIFLGLSEYEYCLLAGIWTNLPVFIQLPVKFKCSKLQLQEKKDLIIIGNSRSIYNNHLDIIEIIEKTETKAENTYVVPFSYGTENEYTREVRHMINDSQKRFELLEDFMSHESYFDLLSSAKAAVFNSYRQMAMGNISGCICSGVKVYLNENNVMFKWLSGLGIKIFTVEDFESDLKYENLQLSPVDYERNIAAFLNISEKYTQKDFLRKIMEFIEKHGAGNYSKYNMN